MKTIKQTNDAAANANPLKLSNPSNIMGNKVSNFYCNFNSDCFIFNQIFQSLLYQLNFGEPNAEKITEMDSSLGNVIDISNILELNNGSTYATTDEIMNIVPGINCLGKISWEQLCGTNSPVTYLNI